MRRISDWAKGPLYSRVATWACCPRATENTWFRWTGSAFSFPFGVNCRRLNFTQTFFTGSRPGNEVGINRRRTLARDRLLITRGLSQSSYREFVVSEKPGKRHLCLDSISDSVADASCRAARTARARAT